MRAWLMLPPSTWSSPGERSKGMPPHPIGHFGMYTPPKIISGAMSGWNSKSSTSYIPPNLCQTQHNIVWWLYLLPLLLQPCIWCPLQYTVNSSNESTLYAITQFLCSAQAWPTSFSVHWVAGVCMIFRLTLVTPEGITIVMASGNLENTVHTYFK